MKKRSVLFLLTAAMVISLSGCGSSSASYKSAAQPDMAMEESYDNAATTEMVSYDYDAEGAEYEKGGSSAGTSSTSTENATNTNRKLIRDMSLSVETKEYDALVKNITDEINALGGYIEFMDVRNNSYNSGKVSRNASLTARIPAAKLDAFVNRIGEQTNITNRTESVRDVTLSYVDIESHKNMLIAERDRLMEYLKQAETVEDMMAIEDHLTDIRYQIDSMESQLRTYDNQVDYSTVNIYVTEVIEYTPVEDPEEQKSAWQRMSEGFARSLKDVAYDVKEFFINLVIDLPYIIIGLIKFAIFLLILFVIVRLIFGKKFRNWWNDKKEDIKSSRAERKAAKKAKKDAKKGIVEPAKDGSITNGSEKE